MEQQILNRVEFIDEERIEDNKERERQLQNDDNNNDENLEDDENYQLKKYTKEELNEMKMNEVITSREKGKMTGPKGVIADYRFYKRYQTQDKPLLETKMLPNIEIQQEIEEIDLELEDDEFFKIYKQKRLNELKDQLKRDIFGRVYPLDLTNFNDAIEKVKPNVTVFIHLYEDDILECHQMNEAFVQLALAYGYAKFCLIRASETSKHFSKDVLPSLLIYRSGQLVYNLIRFIDELKDNKITFETMESTLLKLGALNVNDRFLVE